MEIDPLEYTESVDNEGEKGEVGAAPKGGGDEAQRKNPLNGWVAITVAILATFLAICNVKDGNIVQAMQQAQAKSVDTWAWYQAKKTRTEVYRATALELHLQAVAQPAARRAAFERAGALYEKRAAKEVEELAQTRADAEAQDRLYDAKNYHDDQFDVGEASISLAIALLAITSLTQKRWLFWVALVPASFGVLMGLAGLLGLKQPHPGLFVQFLS